MGYKYDTMKCIITGHTSGVGQSLFEHFHQSGWEVIGMSRSNGYDISTAQDRIVNEAQGCDLFINNASSGRNQLELLQKLCTVVPKIVTMGSAGTDFADIWSKEYTIDKQELEQSCRLISMSPRTDIAKTLLIKLSFAETTYSREKNNRIDSDYTISYKEIADLIDFWILNTNVRQVDFVVKLTEWTVSNVKQLSGKSQLVDELCHSVNKLLP